MKRAGQVAVVLGVALAITVLPGGGGAVDVVFTALSIIFFGALAVALYRAYFQFRFELDALDDRMRAALWGSLGLLVLTLCATSRMFDTGFGILAWFALLGMVAYGLYWVWQKYRALA